MLTCFTFSVILPVILLDWHDLTWARDPKSNILCCYALPD